MSHRAVTAQASELRPHRCRVRRFEPAIELFTHDVAVGAGRGIIGKVGPTLGVGKGVEADADSNTKEDANQNAWNQIGFHLRFSDSKPKPETRNLNPETNFLSPVILNALNFLNDVNVWSVFYFMAA